MSLIKWPSTNHEDNMIKCILIKTLKPSQCTKSLTVGATINWLKPRDLYLESNVDALYRLTNITWNGYKFMIYVINNSDSQ